MEKTSSTIDTIVINVQVDKRLNAYSNKILFPSKVEKAKIFIDKHGLPEAVKEDLVQYKNHLDALQKELLRCYVSEPTNEQISQLNNFLAQLFPNGFD